MDLDLEDKTTELLFNRKPRRRKGAACEWSTFAQATKNMIVYDNLSQKLRNSDDVSLVEKVIEEKKSDPWKAIERIVEMWMKRSPKEFKGFKVQIGDYRNDLRDRKFGTTQNHDQDRRLIMVFPETLMHLIRSVFSPQELIMDKQFYKEFATRFPFFRIPEKL